MVTLANGAGSEAGMKLLKGCVEFLAGLRDQAKPCTDGQPANNLGG